MTKYIKQKVIVSLLQATGNSETPDATTVTVLERDASGNITKAKGVTVPNDAETGYAKGCLFVDTNVADDVPNTYINVDDETGCDFNVMGSDLPAGSVDATELATDSVDSDEIAANAVGNAEMGDNAIGNAEMADNAIGNAEMLDNAVDNAEIATDAVRSDEIQDASIEEVDVSAGLKTHIITMELPGTVAEFGFPFDVETQTEQAAALAVVDDGGDLQLLSTSALGAGVAANYQLFPDVEVENDAAYFGGAAPFGVMFFDMDTLATYAADSLAWEYWNGAAWAALTIVWDQTDTTAQNGLRSFQQDGEIIFSAPSDWASSSVNGQAGFWVRARCNATVNITQTPTTNSVEHKLISAPTAFEMPSAGTIGRARVSFVTESGAAADTDFILCNLTKGTCSAIKTLTKQLTVNEIADFALACDASDQLAVYVTNEEGTTEFADGRMEMTVVKS